MVGDGGLPVGLVDGAVYEQFEVKLHSGDRLLIYSDGISECADQSGKMLGESGLEGIMQGLGDITGEACLEKLVRRLVGFSGTDEMSDDVSAILLDFKACSEPG
jgi:sigma-B regulation protein RsbU (phosphoserine phosphatase)